MTPTFALDLSLDGIRLLFRAEGGWTVVGDVSLEDRALRTRLAALRFEAERIAPGAVTTELIIPPSQIRYATIPAPATLSEDAIRETAAGLTPLEPHELVLDWERDDDVLHLALLDRTTLDEAETFAEAHGFNPVTFGARPTADQFPRPARFGTTARAADPAPGSVLLLERPEATRPRPDDAAVVGAEALALSLSAPHPGTEAPATPASRSGGLAVAAVAALLLVGTGALVGLRGGLSFAPTLPDTPPRVALAAPAPLAPPAALSAAASVAPSAAQDATRAAPVEALAAPAALAGPAGDTAAPPAPVARASVPPDVAGPRRPTPPAQDASEAIYLASIDPVTQARDALALPVAALPPAAPRPATSLAPPPPGAPLIVALDDPPRAVPTPDLAREDTAALDARPQIARPEIPPSVPPTVPPAIPAAAPPGTPPGVLSDGVPAAPDATGQPVLTATAAAIPALRPTNRPADLVERRERAALGGWTRAELAGFRPAPRPVSLQTLAEAAQPATPTDLAIAASPLPRDRPADLALRAATEAAIATALAADVPVPTPLPVAAAPQPQVAAAVPAAAPVEDDDDGEPEVLARAPDIPTSASVARQATIENAMRLREINLIGVYGTERDRRALVRLANGRFVKVKVGDRLDGGQIAAIGRDELRYVRGGRNVTLQVPSG